MPSVVATLRVRTGRSQESQDITDQVQRAVRESRIGVGIAVLAVRHTTAGLAVNENERGLVSDLEGFMDRLVPAHKGYAHDRVDDNAHSHLRSIVLGNSLALPVVEGELELGTWQRVFLVEQDGPRERTIRLVVTGDES
jgi:secondary thiamine-phosphate synthase enzyme